MRSTLLVTGFEPFGGESVNPALLAARALGLQPDAIEGLRIAWAALPVDVLAVRAALDTALDAARPTALLMLGQAAGRATIDIETRAVNQIAYGQELDNGGHHVQDDLIAAGGPAQLDATLPLVALEPGLQAAGHPVRISRDAGRFLCNFVLYDVLHRHAHVPAGFVHLPLLPEQSARRACGEPALPLGVTLRCLSALLAALAPRLRPSGIA